MYICLCNGYTDRQVREAASRCGSVSDLYRCLGAPPRCGKCVATVTALYRDSADAAAPPGSDD